MKQQSDFIEFVTLYQELTEPQKRLVHWAIFWILVKQAARRPTWRNVANLPETFFTLVWPDIRQAVTIGALSLAFVTVWALTFWG